MQISPKPPPDPSLARCNRALAEICLKQFGVFSREQALGVGLTKAQIQHRIRIGEWERLMSCVYKFRSDPLTWEAMMCGALLWAGEGAAASHRAAARIWKFPGFESCGIEIVSPKPLRATPQVAVHRNALSPHEVAHKGPLRVTSVARTLLDLAGVVPKDSVDSALDHALLMGLVTVPRLVAQLDHCSGRGKRGTHTLRKILEGRDPTQRPSESELERRFLRILKRNGVPSPTAQLHVDLGRGNKVRIDFAYQDRKIAIETDGYIWHGGKVRWLKDAERTNQLTELGWRVIRLGWKDVTERPDIVIERIRRLLAAHP